LQNEIAGYAAVNCKPVEKKTCKVCLQLSVITVLSRLQATYRDRSSGRVGTLRQWDYKK